MPNREGARSPFQLRLPDAYDLESLSDAQLIQYEMELRGVGKRVRKSISSRTAAKMAGTQPPLGPPPSKDKEKTQGKSKRILITKLWIVGITILSETCCLFCCG